jgi:hypothetical protein
VKRAIFLVSLGFLVRVGIALGASIIAVLAMRNERQPQGLDVQT